MGRSQRRSQKIKQLTDLIENFAGHQSWRCEHPDRYPWTEPNYADGPPDCPCGLVSALRDAGLPVEWAGAESRPTAEREHA